MRAATFLCLLLLSTVLAAGPAEAKGAQSVTITGPGLDEPLEIDLAGGNDDTPSYLVVALMELANPYSINAGLDLAPEPPPRPLKDRYTITWQMAHPTDADPSDSTVVQDVYPDAVHNPVLHVRAGTWLDSDGGWTESSPALRDTLVALGVPLSGAPSLAATRSPAPTPSDTTAPWPLPVTTATVGAAAGLALGVAFTRRRLRSGAQLPPGR